MNSIPADLKSKALETPHLAAGVVCADQISILKAVKEGVGINLIDPMLIGNKNLIIDKANEVGLNIENFEIINTKIIFSTVVELESSQLSKNDMEKIILIEIPNKIYPELRKIFIFLFENSGFKDVKISEVVDFENLYKMRKVQ